MLGTPWLLYLTPWYVAALKHSDVAGASVLLHVVQGLLKNSVERQFGGGGKPLGKLGAGQLDWHPRPVREFGAGVAQDGGQAQMVQSAGP